MVGNKANNLTEIFLYSEKSLSGSINPRKEETVLITSIGWAEDGIYYKTSFKTPGIPLLEAISVTKASVSYSFGSFPNNKR